MSGGGAGSAEESVLETPTYSIALILLAFQVVSVVFSLIVKGIQRALLKRRKVGMLAAVNHSVHELTLLGFVSLVLIALQNTITNICVDKGYFDTSWTVLSSVYSEGYCPCCLEHTNSVQQCVLEYAACGNSLEPFCNCDMKDPSCVGEVAAYEAVVEEEEEQGIYCEGPRTIDGYQCSEGKVKAVSYLTLEQVHLLIFTVSIIHVICGFVLYGICRLRVKLEWGSWEKCPTVHSEKVQEALDEYFKGLDVQKDLMRKSQEVAKQDGAANGGEEMHKSASCPRIDDALEEGESTQDGPPMLQRLSAPLPKVLHSDSFIVARVKTLRKTSKSFSDLLQLEKDLMKRCIQKVKRASKRIYAFLYKPASCVIQGMGPFLVTKKQYAKLRASFMYTHKMGSSFDFLNHLLQSIEEDFSHLVGITPIFWIGIILFWLVSGAMGYAVMPAMIINAVVMIILNAKLVSIVQNVTDRGGAAVMLETNVFWFNRPALLLQPMKLSLFICSYLFASFLFFVWQFSATSCPFSDAFYPQWALPWWTIILFNLVIFIHLAAVTFPAYSLAVQMGSDLKGHMLPKRLAKKLLLAVEEAKRKVRQEKAAAKAAADALHARQLNFLTRRSASRAISGAASVFVSEPTDLSTIDKEIE
ncbi:hypothetical protein M9434_000320 [Picochlorum sp. BPE23]|nr:hypothetical protein M9434_000320 [Picochlorum sp. BPE23]